MNVTEPGLRALTDSRSWQRGVDYFESGLVLSLREEKDRLIAEVEGTRPTPYRVVLHEIDGEIEGECTCPMGEAGVFCKHCVATGLAYLSSRKGEPGAPVDVERGPRVTSLDDLRQYLSGLNKAELVDIVAGQAAADGALWRDLSLRAALAERGGADIPAIKAALAEATDPGGFVDYGSVSGFAGAMQAALDAVQKLLEAGRAGDVIELSEFALERLEDALGQMDDSNGCMSGVVERLRGLHLAACESAKPEPEALARRLFEWEMRSEWDFFSGAAETYAHVLGHTGLAAYRALAEAEWAKVPPLETQAGQTGYDHQRHQVTSIMESLARVSGDVEELVAVKQRDLSSTYRYLNVAATYHQARKYNKALEWAEAGLKAFPERPDSRLREFLVREYRRRRRHDDALAMLWANFVDRPRLMEYRDLEKYAKRIGQWPPWRERALDHLRETRASDRWAGGHSKLVEIFLWEKEREAAWQEARAHGCSGDQWLRLAGGREKEHPADAVRIYQQEVERLVNQTNNAAYREAVGLVRRIRGLMKRLGQDKAFAKWIEHLRTTRKRKRNFMDMLDRLERTGRL